MKRVFLMVATVAATMLFCMCSGKNDIPIESNWRVEHIFKNSQEVVIPAEHDVTLAFLKDSKIAGETGCNRFFGDFKISENNLELSNIASTRMMCPDIQFENSFLEVIKSAASYNVNEDKLTLKDSSGNIIVILKQIAPTAMEN